MFKGNKSIMSDKERTREKPFSEEFNEVEDKGQNHLVLHNDDENTFDFGNRPRSRPISFFSWSSAELPISGSLPISFEITNRLRAVAYTRSLLILIFSETV